VLDHLRELKVKGSTEVRNKGLEENTLFQERLIQPGREINFNKWKPSYYTYQIIEKALTSHPSR
jgi:hypothetical protein